MPPGKDPEWHRVVVMGPKGQIYEMPDARYRMPEFLPLLRLRPEDSCRVSFACCYTYAGILPHEVLADAGGTAAEISESWHLASRKSAPSVP